MPDSPERNVIPSRAAEQTFPLAPFNDLSKLDQKLFANPTQQRSDQSTKPAGSGAADTLKVPDLHQSIYQSPFQQTPNSDAKPKPASTTDSKPKPAELPTLPVPPLVFPVPGERNNIKPSDKTPSTIAPGPDGKIEITEKDFDKIGPKAKEVLTNVGVTKLTITPGQGFDTYEAELKKPLEVDQDPSIDGTRKLKMATHFKADVRQDPDGSLNLDNIEGLTAESKILFKFRDAQVEKISIKQNADGKSEITSTGSWNGMSGTKNRTQPAEIFEKAKILFDRMQALKGNSNTLEIPPINR